MAGWGFLRTKALASHMAGFDQRVYLFEEAEMSCWSVIDNTWIYACSSCRGAHKTLHALRECMTIAGILLLATSSALTGIAARPRRVAAVVGAGMLLLPQLLHRPLVRRLECAPWPRKEWVRPSPLRGLGNTSRPS
jgi:hypothetical protein